LQVLPKGLKQMHCSSSSAPSTAQQQLLNIEQLNDLSCSHVLQMMGADKKQTYADGNHGVLAEAAALGRAPQLIHLNLAQGIGRSDLRGREMNHLGSGRCSSAARAAQLRRCGSASPCACHKAAAEPNAAHGPGAPSSLRSAKPSTPRRASLASCGGYGEEASPHQ